jgi:cytochrome c peroxidase
MRFVRLAGSVAICAAPITAASLLSFHHLRAQSASQVFHPIYDPYPPGILPSDIASEEARMRREVNGIFYEAIGEWQALPPVTPRTSKS